MVQGAMNHGIFGVRIVFSRILGAGTMRSHSTYEFVVGRRTTFGVES